jgi:cell wall assembly regulator SMI1
MSALIDALNQISEWLQQHNWISPSIFQPGLSIEEIESELGKLPFYLSCEVCELYQWHDGSSDSKQGIFVHHDLLSFENALEYSQGINDRDWLETRREEGEPIYLFPVFDFDGEFFAVLGNSVFADSLPA